MVRAGAVILAAGSSRRLGQPKQLIEFRGETLVHRMVRAGKEAGCDPVIVVTGAFHESITASVADLHSLVVRNENWARGIGSSIRVGVAQLTAHDLNVIILLTCDQPAVDSTVICA